MIVRVINKFRFYQNILYSFLLKRSFKCCGKGFYVEYPIRIHGSEYIEIGNGFSSFGRLRIEAFSKHNGYEFSPKIKIGDNVSLNFDCHIGAINEIVIGNNVLVASKVFITDHFHGDICNEELNIPPARRKLYSKGKVKIQDNVWIGEGVCILPGVTIGENCIIGANSVVTKSFPANSIIGGVPAKLLKNLDS